MMRPRSSTNAQYLWPAWTVPAGKALAHTALILPLVFLLEAFQSGRLAALADPVSYITHVTGKWALWVLLASLAVTPARRLHPILSPLVRFRRMLGLYAFLYASLHLATYLFLFSGFDLPAAVQALGKAHFHEVSTQWRSVWPTILGDLKRRRFIQVGLLSWTLLFVLAITSPHPVLRLLGGRAWRRIHQAVYVAAVAAIVHFWWMVKAGDRAPWKVTAILLVLLGARAAHAASRDRSRAI